MNSTGEFREALTDLFERITCGPLTGSESIASAPGDTYLSGILWPKGATAEAVEDESMTGGVADDTGTEHGVPGYRSMKPCSIGVTFSVAEDAVIHVELGSTARYDARPLEKPTADQSSESDKRDSDRPRRPGLVWQHRLLGYSLELAAEEAGYQKNFNLFRNIDGSTILDQGVTIHVRRRVLSGIATVTVTLINSTPEEEDPALRDAACIFQTQLVVSASQGGVPVGIIPRKQISPSTDDADALSNFLIYREAREYAIGHGVSAEWSPPETTGVAWVRTSWLPKHSVTGTSPEGHRSMQAVRKIFPRLLDAGWLHVAPKDDVLAGLSALTDCYSKWIDDELVARIDQFYAGFRIAAEGNLARCLETARRLKAGIATLSENDQAWTAFCLANEAMDMQAGFPAKGDRAGPLKWRPFQLAFIVMTISSLADSSSKDRECMDLLWFPTGGGKTEAYLGLTAFQIFLRRLESATARDRGGVDVLMRYTLRLLTVQQFQRAAALISACELIRLRDVAELGQARITIGLYVGKDTTPNSMTDARDSLHREAQGETPKSTPRQLLACPVCATSLTRHQYRASATTSSLDIICGAPGCAMGVSTLPVLTVDECIYSTPTSLLIGTVDKFAQLPRSIAMRALFGLPHDLPPGLIIQDELHLISGPLGSMSGLYESAIDILCTREGVRPKIIGSTATIGRAERQVRALFDRSVLQFPPPGIDAGDSFFAVKEIGGRDRMYLGLPTAGRSPKFALQAVLAALLESAQVLRPMASGAMIADPYWTCVAYFNSLRELGAAHVLVQDDVPRQMTFISRRLAVNAPRPMAKNPVAELSSRVASRDIPTMLQRLEARLDADPYHEQAEDVVLASNMISVGVDVPRLGLMVVNGQPKSTSEYIQATSRVGRSEPGLVVTLYNFGRPRDLSHFEHFKGYHDALYRAVEATSVTPWAPRARDKALPAILVGAVRQLLPEMTEDEAASRLQSGDPRVKGIVDELIRRCRIASAGIEDQETAQELHAIVKLWESRAADARATGKKLLFWERRSKFGNASPHLLRSAEDGGNPGSLSWAAAGSLREVEPSAAFALRQSRRV